MKLTVITLFTAMFQALEYGVVGKAIQKGIVSINYINPRDFATDPYKTVDDRPYGGGPGMVMKAEPLCAAIDSASQNLGADTKVLYLSPQGKRLEQQQLQKLATRQKMILVCGRYEGVDQRVIDTRVDEEWSIGDYVLSGGELPAMVMIDTMVRLLPGALGHECSAVEDSFTQGLLDYPHYTRPETFQDQRVPAVLLSGDHPKIQRWRLKQALGKTWQKRPDLFEQLHLTVEEQKLLHEFENEIRGVDNSLG